MGKSGINALRRKGLYDDAGITVKGITVLEEHDNAEHP